MAPGAGRRGRPPRHPLSGTENRSALQRLRADQRVAYLLAGGVNTAFGLSVFVVLYLSIGDAIGYLGSLAAAYALALALGFTLQRRLVFKVRGRLVGDFLRYLIVQVGALTLNAVLLPVLVELAGAPVIPAQIVALVLTVIASFLLHRSFTFARDPA